MDLEAVSAELRPRNPWEAIDLGFALARVYAAPLYGAWLLLTVPVVLAIGVGTVSLGVPWLGPLLLWWGKPVLDRVPLHVLSRALFGAAPTVGQTLRAAPGLWFRRLGYALTVARADPARAFAASIFQLEGQTGAAARARRRVLSSGTLGPSLGLLLVTHLLEWVIVLGLVVFATLLLPDTPQYAGSALWAAFWDGTAPTWLLALLPLGYGLAVLAVEPLYVAGGFALYLNRRTGLEGWDVEVAFRRLAARLSAPLRHSAGLLLAVVLAAHGGVGSAHAADATTPEQGVTTVLARPEFPHTQTVTHWHLRYPKDEFVDSDTPPVGSAFGALFANLFEALLWAALAVAVVGLVIVLVRTRAPRKAGEEEDRPAPPRLGIGLDLRPESLPRNLADAAWALWLAGEHLAAVALLYRGALVDLITQRNMAVEEGATERDCLQLAARLLDPRAALYFVRLTAAWQEAAYGHRFPADEAASTLCQRWPEHFQGVA